MGIHTNDKKKIENNKWNRHHQWAKLFTVPAANDRWTHANWHFPTWHHRTVCSPHPIDFLVCVCHSVPCRFARCTISQLIDSRATVEFAFRSKSVTTQTTRIFCENCRIRIWTCRWTLWPMLDDRRRSEYCHHKQKQKTSRSRIVDRTRSMAQSSGLFQLRQFQWIDETPFDGKAIQLNLYVQYLLYVPIQFPHLHFLLFHRFCNRFLLPQQPLNLFLGLETIEQNQIKCHRNGNGFICEIHFGLPSCVRPVVQCHQTLLQLLPFTLQCVQQSLALGHRILLFVQK